MNHTFNPARIMSDKDMVKRQDYVVHVTSNEGKKKEHVMDCYRNALTKAMHSMNPNVHMIIINAVDDKRYNDALQRWDRVREVDGNEWEECAVDDLMTIGKIVEFVIVEQIDHEGNLVSCAKTHKKTKHHWWGLLRHMQRYGDFLNNDDSDDNWANGFLLKRLRETMQVVGILAEICDHKEQQQQPTKFPFMKSGKNSKVTLAAMTEYLNADYSDDPALASMIARLREAVDKAGYSEYQTTNEFMRDESFSFMWRSIREQWQDLVYF